MAPSVFFFFFQAEDGIRDYKVTGVQTCALPIFIRLVKFVHVPRRFRRQVTNTFLFARDNYRCQFCGRSQQELRHRECLTRDHLVPLSRGGTNGWSNVLTACSSCNTRKGNLLPEEAGMHPLRPPFEPHFVHLAWAGRRLTSIQSQYIRLFYGGGGPPTPQTVLKVKPRGTPPPPPRAWGAGAPRAPPGPAGR